MPVRIVALDLYGTLLDLDAVVEVLRDYTPMAHALAEAWRERQLQLANASASSNRYADFDRLTFMALHETAPRFHAKLTPADQKRLLDAWAMAPAYADAFSALTGIVQRRLPAVVITNARAATAAKALESAALAPYISRVFSADDVQSYKPNGKVYAQVNVLGVDPPDVLFVSANDWDVMGARQAGFQTVWINRRRANLSPKPERTIASLDELPAVLDEYLLSRA